MLDDTHGAHTQALLQSMYCADKIVGDILLCQIMRHVLGLVGAGTMPSTGVRNETHRVGSEQRLQIGLHGWIKH